MPDSNPRKRIAVGFDKQWLKIFCCFMIVIVPFFTTMYIDFYSFDKYFQDNGINGPYLAHYDLTTDKPVLDEPKIVTNFVTGQTVGWIANLCIDPKLIVYIQIETLKLADNVDKFPVDLSRMQVRIDKNKSRCGPITAIRTINPEYTTGNYEVTRSIVFRPDGLFSFVKQLNSIHFSVKNTFNNQTEVAK